MSTSLFLDTSLDFGPVKQAGVVTHMSDAAEKWPEEIMGEAYKTLPFLGNFDVNVVLDKVDDTRGYGFGSIEVRPRSDLPAADQRKLALIHIPILIKDQNLQPLDLFIHGGKYHHLTESRLRATMFRPETFDSAQKAPPDPSFVTDLMPPSQGIFYGGGVKLSQDMALSQAPAQTPFQPSVTPQTSAASASQQVAQAPAPPTAETKVATLIPILPQLEGRVLQQHSDRIKVAMQDPSLLTSFQNANEGVQAALLSALQLSPINLEKSAEVLQRNLRPDAVQITKLANGRFMVKWAAADMYAPQQEEVQPQVAQKLTGQGTPADQQLNAEGATTAGTGDVSQAVGDEPARVVDQYGIWKVEEASGQQLIGYAFPALYSLDNQPLGLSLFTNGSQFAVQEGIAGKMIGKATDLPKAPPLGYGCFYTSSDGTARAFEPMKITATFQDPSGLIHYTSQLDSGQGATFTFSDVIKAPTRVSETDVIIPSSYRWLPLKSETKLVQDPAMFTKVATSNWKKTAELVSDGNVYSYRGPAVEKIASEASFIDRRQTEFLGVLMGMNPRFVKTAADRAARGERVALRGLRQITPIHEKMASARQAIRAELEDLNPPIRNYFLLKEASILEDALTADTILGLGFLNAENVNTFVEMLPCLEETSSKLAELLMAIRLGRKEIPEVAVERSLAALDDVINGLRVLKQKEVRFGE